MTGARTRVLYLVIGESGWFACVLSAARGIPWLGTAFALLLIAVHIVRAPKPLEELKFVAGVTLIGTLWESVLVNARLLSYPSGMLDAHLAPYWIIALWALFAAQFNTSYVWLKQRVGLGAVLGAVAGPVSFHAGAALHALRFERPWPATLALALGWACIVPLVTLLSYRFDGVSAGT